MASSAPFRPRMAMDGDLILSELVLRAIGSGGRCRLPIGAVLRVTRQAVSPGPRTLRGQCRFRGTNGAVPLADGKAITSTGADVVRAGVHRGDLPSIIESS